MKRFYSVLINWAAILSCELFGCCCWRHNRPWTQKIWLPSYITPLLVIDTAMLHCKIWVSDVSLSSEMKFQLQLPFLIMQLEQELWKTDFSVLIKYIIWHYAFFTLLTFQGIFCFCFVRFFSYLFSLPSTAKSHSFTQPALFPRRSKVPAHNRHPIIEIIFGTPRYERAHSRFAFVSPQRVR